jgi:cell division transport system permease protein
MFWLNFKRIFKTGFINFWRNGVVSLSAVLVMVITLFIVAGIIFSSALLNHTLISLENKIDININLLPEVSEESVSKIQTDLESLPQIETVELWSREQVLENFIANNQDEQTTLSALELLDDNPFGAALRIRAVDLDQYEVINQFLADNYSIGENNSIIDDVNFSQKQLVISRLKIIIDAGEKFGAIITVVFIILSVLITLNTIRLAMYISRDEIKIMNLVGANHSYITGPFVVAGAIYGIISAVIVLILLYPVLFYVSGDIAKLFFDLNLFKYYVSNFGQIFSIIFLSGIALGAVSSFLAINRYLKK